MSADHAAERARLHGYIAASQRVQRRMVLVSIGLAAVSLAILLAVDGRLGGILLLGSAIVGGSGFWVTAAHIADWRLKLRTLDQNRQPGDQRISRKRAR